MHFLETSRHPKFGELSGNLRSLGSLEEHQKHHLFALDSHYMSGTFNFYFVYLSLAMLCKLIFVDFGEIHGCLVI